MRMQMCIVIRFVEELSYIVKIISNRANLSAMVLQADL